MSYEVLARKWRPQTFDEVVGQDHITRTLKKAVDSGRLSHAYLFSGPRGCGKTSTARILAKVINCTDLKEGNPCNACESCRGVVRGNNLDVMEIDGASHTGVAEVRDLQESIGYSPSQFLRKVYIIDEVHMLSTHAFNALLKTLEEPPSHVYFVFATTAPHKIPDTIKSRCQRHQFKRLEVSEIAAQLERICEAEKVAYESEALRLLARKAEGSMRDGESLLDQVITASSGDVKTKSVRQILGLLDQEMIGGFLHAIGERDATAVLKQLDRAVQEGVDLEELLNALIEGFRDLMLLASPGDLSELIYRSSDEVETLRAYLAPYELGDLVTIVERLCNTAPRLKTASDPRILLESVLVDLSLLDRQVVIQELIDRLEGAGGQDEPTGGRARRKPTRDKPRGERGSSASAGGAARVDGIEPDPPGRPPPVPMAGFSADTKRDANAQRPANGGLSGGPVDGVRNKDWDGFVTHVRQKKVALGVCLISGSLRSFDDKGVTIRFAKGLSFQRDQVERPSNREFLRKALKKYFGRDLDFTCVTEGETDEGNGSVTPSGDGGDSTPRRPIESKPIMKKILADFDGEIIRHNPQQGVD